MTKWKIVPYFMQVHEQFPPRLTYLPSSFDMTLCSGLHVVVWSIYLLSVARMFISSLITAFSHSYLCYLVYS